MNTDCPICQPEPERPHRGPGTPISMPGTRHRRECPTLPQWTRQDHAEWQTWLDEYRRCMARAYVASITTVIG